MGLGMPMGQSLGTPRSHPDQGYVMEFKIIIKSNQNQINFIGIKSSHKTVTSHMYTVTQEQSQT